MTKFYLYRKQSGEGCDYTIGCASALNPLKAETLDAAIVEASDPDEYGLAADDERELKEAMIFAAPVHVFDLEQLRNAAEAESELAEQIVQDERDRLEFERLQQKFKK